MLSFELLKHSHASLWGTEHEEARGDSGRCQDAVSAIIGNERVAHMRVLPMERRDHP